MNTKSTILFLGLLMLMNLSSIAQQALLTQNIRGQVVDKESQTTLPGVNVTIVNSSPIKGTATDNKGNFVLKEVKLGRVNLHFSYLGYEAKTISNIEIGSAKEVVLHVEMQESVSNIQEVKIFPKTAKHETLNQMSTVSGQSFTIEETSRYSGAMYDPARMVSAYAGVSNNAQGSNEIIVRGNSPRGIQWRLEDIEIANPNHFAGQSASGGAVNALNSKMLRNSDFFTGAFTAEYGNAFSGVFDINLRKGNNQKHENIFSFSTNGIDFTTEGPIAPNYSGSYLINYRYSSLQLLNNTGIINMQGVPKFQDASFMVDLPTQQSGRFKLFGLWGKNSMKKETENEEETLVLQKNDLKANLAVFGLSHQLTVGKASYLKHTVAYVSNSNQLNSQLLNSKNSDFFPYQYISQKETQLKLSSKFNTKLNAKNSLKAGFDLNKIYFDVFGKNDYNNSGTPTTTADSDGDAEFFQSFVSWKHRFNSKLSTVVGMHALYFSQNKEYSYEPRLGIEYKINSAQTLSFGSGIHSKKEALSTYSVKTKDATGKTLTPNARLKMDKALHFVLGYNWQLNPNLHFKAEAYYQHLYNLATENDKNSSVVLQDLHEVFFQYDFVNKGKGKNYGIDLSLERFLNDNYYYTFTASLYDAKLKGLNGIERNSRYNGKFMLTFLFGKEFNAGRSKQNVFGVHTKLSYAGGQYYTPIDYAQSLQAGKSIYKENMAFKERGDNVMILNTTFNYKINRRKVQHEIKLELKNMLGGKAKLFEYYDEAERKIDLAEQLPLVPSIYYVFYF